MHLVVAIIVSYVTSCCNSMRCDELNKIQCVKYKHWKTWRIV